jgi:putative endonuclease
MHFTYILYSKKLNSYYKGETKNILDRLHRHNSGYEKSTKLGTPWILLWKGEKTTKSEAKVLERKIKNLSVKRTLEFILKYKEGVPSADELLLFQKLSECWLPRQHSTLGLATRALTVSSGLFYLLILPYNSLLKYKEGVPSADELDLIIMLSKLSAPDVR